MAGAHRAARARPGRHAGRRAGAVPAARDPVAAPVAIGDLDGTAGPEVVATSLGGRAYVFGADGRLRPGWP
jgi:hypothetical protein